MSGNSSDMETTVAALFLSAGKEALTEDEAIKVISMDRRWFYPKFAKKFLKNALGSGLLKNENGLLKPGFDIHSVDVPFGYLPPASILSEFSDPHPDDKSAHDMERGGGDAPYPFVEELMEIMERLRSGEKIENLMHELNEVERKLTMGDGV